MKTETTKKEPPKKGKGKRIILTILTVILVIAAVAMFVLYRMAASMGIGTATVEDYGSRIEIWENAAGNHSGSKLDDMNINDRGNEFLSFIAFAQGIIGEEYRDEERTLDTFTFLHEIKGGYEAETYEDIPYLIPYVVEGSQTAVVIMPGGGYGYKSMDGTTGEGKEVAVSLNEAGITAFVLHYRSNPYEYPIPHLDVQRAVRYLRAHAGEYGFDPDRIGLIGFSAGGYQVGGYINLIMGNDMFPEDYTPDEIDAVDDTVYAAGMIYPVLDYDHNIPMLFCSFDDELVRDDAEREKLLEMTDLSKHFNSESIPQFVAYGTKDTMVGTEGATSYIAAATDAEAVLSVTVAEGQAHGFGQEYYMDDFIDWMTSLP
ncbi:MAG: alpha/beta hydrolase [Candidatus Ventricola sp.]